MDQADACTRARMVGERAMEVGCTPTDVGNPSMAELARQCDQRGVDIHDVLAAC